MGRIKNKLSLCLVHSSHCCLTTAGLQMCIRENEGCPHNSRLARSIKGTPKFDSQNHLQVLPFLTDMGCHMGVFESYKYLTFIGLISYNFYYVFKKLKAVTIAPSSDRVDYPFGCPWVIPNITGSILSGSRWGFAVETALN